VQEWGKRSPTVVAAADLLGLKLHGGEGLLRKRGKPSTSTR
jgi:hypothetical protein